MIIISIKLVSQNDLYVQHPVSYDAYLKIIYKPEAAYFLWFAWALFDIFLLCVLSECSNSNTLGKLILFIPFPQD